MTARVLFVVALIAFIFSMRSKDRIHAYVGATLLLAVIIIGSCFPTPTSNYMIAREERAQEQSLIDQARVLDKDAHVLLVHTPHTRQEAQNAADETAHFLSVEQAWLTRAEQGKPLKDYVDADAATAAIRIVAADSYLTGAVQSAMQHCDPKDADMNMDRADAIIADADAALHGHGDPHFQAKDLTNQLNGTDACSNDGG
jgi:hypothetical protein